MRDYLSLPVCISLSIKVVAGPVAGSPGRVGSHIAIQSVQFVRATSQEESDPMTTRLAVRLTQRNLKFPLQAVSRLTFMLVFALAMAGTAVAQAVPPQVGPYGFVVNTASSNNPCVQGGSGILGVINFDGVGGITGSYTLELGTGGQCGGPQQPVTVPGNLTGTYVANPDGLTWTTTLDLHVVTGNFDEHVIGTFVMVVSGQGRGLQLALTGCTGFLCDLSENVVSAIGEVQSGGSTKTISKGFLTGSYGMQSTKNVPSPQTSVEVWTFYPNGTVTLSGTAVAPGPTVVCTGNSAGCGLQGTYSVNPDGTGTITIPPPPGGQNTKTFVFVVTNGHSGLLALQTNRAGDGVLYEVGQLQ